MKTRVMLSVLGLLCLAATAAWPADKPLIAYADLQKALNESDAGIKAIEDLQKEAKELEAELNSQQAELKKLKEEIDSKRAIWNAETLDARQREFQVKSQEFQGKYMQYNERLNKKRQETEASIINDLREIVEELAEKEGYAYVLEKSMGGILVAPADADITGRVIELYNERFKEKEGK
ncbi:MAG TPA: OmpH family outer membrane protein [Deltaproteobacteria bacterium]|nr:OmpH family outer membrane protein [Deltaproteobacteria bacterium]